MSEEGEITVPAKLLTDLVASLPEPAHRPPVLSPKDRTLKVTCGGSRSSIKGIEADEFPVVAAIGDAPATSVDCRALREALGEVVFAAATDESRPILTGVLTRLTGSQMTLAAADNYRIAVRHLELASPVNGEILIVVPGRSYGELMRILPDGEAPVEITVTPNKSQVLFHAEGIDLVSRLIEGQFPNYEPVIPTAHTSRAVIDREAFLAGARRASIFARDSANIVKIAVGSEEEDASAVSISAHAADIGDAADCARCDRRGLADDDRLQRPLPDRRAEQPRRGGGGARAVRTPRAGRHPRDRQGRLRARHHAGPHRLLTPAPAAPMRA